MDKGIFWLISFIVAAYCIGAAFPGPFLTIRSKITGG